MRPGALRKLLGNDYSPKEHDDIQAQIHSNKLKSTPTSQAKAFQRGTRAFDFRETESPLTTQTINLAATFFVVVYTDQLTTLLGNENKMKQKAIFSTLSRAAS